MLNCNDFNSILECSADSAKNTLEGGFSAIKFSFNEIDQFPKNKGLYFVFLGEEVIYIGKAEEQNIQTRCNQNLTRDSGGTLRKKIRCVQNCNDDNAINYIKENLSAKFITEIDSNNISVIEEIAIWAFQSKLNAIKPGSFEYERLSFN